MPKVSVVMSTYNSQKYLLESIDSISKQTFEDFEFVIINDASTDGSVETLKEISKYDGRIKTINNRKKLGLTKSLILLLPIAKENILQEWMLMISRFRGN